MKADDLIKTAFDEEVAGMDISDEVYKKMLDYIEGRSEEEDLKFDFNILKNLREFISKLRFNANKSIISKNKYESDTVFKREPKFTPKVVGAIEVLAFVLILFTLPSFVKQYSNKITSNISNKNQAIVDGNEKSAGENEKKSVTITLSDNMDGYNKAKDKVNEIIDLDVYLVSDTDMKDVINELRKSGAISITVNSEQISEVSDIATFGQFIRINGNDYDSPFTIKALWNKNISAINLLEDNNIINGLKARGLGVKMEETYNLTSNDIQDSNSTPNNDISETKDNDEPINEEALPSNVKRIKDKDEIYKQVSFTIEKPTIKVDSLTEIDIQMDVIDIEGNRKYQIVKTLYKNDKGKSISIYQANDTGRPGDGLLDRAKQVKINEIDGWVIGDNSEKGLVQVMFWRDNKYFNVFGKGIEEDKLIEIAESLE